MLKSHLRLRWSWLLYLDPNLQRILCSVLLSFWDDKLHHGFLSKTEHWHGPWSNLFVSSRQDRLWNWCRSGRRKSSMDLTEATWRRGKTGRNPTNIHDWNIMKKWVEMAVHYDWCCMETVPTFQKHQKAISVRTSWQSASPSSSYGELPRSCLTAVYKYVCSLNFY